jgi:hypothetical protein
MEWVRQFPDSPWYGAAGDAVLEKPVPLVSIRYQKRELQPA